MHLDCFPCSFLPFPFPSSRWALGCFPLSSPFNVYNTPSLTIFLIPFLLTSSLNTSQRDGLTHHSKYPSTPSRIQISIWPAGISSSAQGTIDWAGGMIDWTNSDYTTNGYFWNTLQSVKISCADDGNATVGSTGWAYGDGNATVGLVRPDSSLNCARGKAEFDAGGGSD